MEQKGDAIIVFVRNPELGKVKTRLAQAIGDEATLEVYHKLLAYTKESIINLPCHKYIFYTDNITVDDLWDDDIFYKKVQHGADLGERMANAFNLLFTLGYTRVMIVGSDCPSLRMCDIENGFSKMHDAEVVIGPTIDGGYYLLGIQKYLPNIFKNIHWSTEVVLQQTIAAVSDAALTYQLLPTLNDIDTIADWDNFLLSHKH